MSDPTPAEIRAADELMLAAPELFGPLPDPIPVGLVHSTWPVSCLCRCGARRQIIDAACLDQVEPSFIPGALIDPCICPRCFTCQRPLDDDGRCGNIHCLNLGLHIPSPD